MTWNWYLLRNLSYSLVECLSAEQVGSSADGLRPNAGGEVKSTDSERVKWSGNFNSCLSCHFYLFHMQFGETVNTGGWKQAAYCCTTKWLPWATSAACGHFPVAFISLQCILIPFFFFFCTQQKWEYVACTRSWRRAKSCTSVGRGFFTLGEEKEECDCCGSATMRNVWKTCRPRRYWI